MAFKIIGIVVLSLVALVAVFLILPLRFEMIKSADGVDFWLKVLFFKKNLNKTAKKIMAKKDNEAAQKKNKNKDKKADKKKKDKKSNE